FYYEEMSVKEIAAAMGVSESAVKSRLMYGRKKIEKKVRELEKQGTKLYGLSPLPFLLLLFRNQKAYAAEVPDSHILHAILASQSMGTATAAGTAQGDSTVGAAAGTEAVGTAAAAGGLGILKIGLIALVVVAVVGLGAFGATRTVSRFAELQKPSVIEDVTDQEEPSFTEDNIDQEKLSTIEDVIGAEESEAPADLDPLDEALEQYRIIISQADSYDYGEYAETNQPWQEFIGYRYALVQMRLDDSVPTLLLEREIMDTELSVSMYYARVFQYDLDTKTVHQPTESIADGGIRGGLSMAGDGHGIVSTGWSSGTGEGSVTRITLDEDSLNRDTFWSGQIFEMPDSITFVEIEWHDIGDLSSLDHWTAPDLSETSSSEPSDDDALPTDGNRIVLTGTVGTYDYDEIVELQRQPDPTGWDEQHVAYARSRTYHVIVLDTPQTLRLYSGEDARSYSNEALMINLEYTDAMDPYEGQHITFSIDPNTTHWPSDTSLPIGQPFTSDIHVLE
ncbi:MAG: sigma-70 family RNA polymerase sigma factor, partial [Lachnospiraceae bacterium]|nr:sigma-70 family RNA polymerase sigma factor [Lachnospiraceae bacterium]